MLKNPLLVVGFVINSTIASAQDLGLNGDYTSHKTSYQYINKEDNCFVEDTVNNIFIHIVEDSGVFAF